MTITHFVGMVVDWEFLVTVAGRRARCPKKVELQFLLRSVCLLLRCKIQYLVQKDAAGCDSKERVDDGIFPETSQ